MATLLDILDRLDDMDRRIQELEDEGGAGLSDNDWDNIYEVINDKAYDVARDAGSDAGYDAGNDAGSEAGYSAARQFIEDEPQYIAEKISEYIDAAEGERCIVLGDTGYCTCTHCQRNHIFEVVADAIHRFFRKFYLEDDGFTITEHDTEAEINDPWEIYERIRDDE